MVVNILPKTGKRSKQQRRLDKIRSKVNLKHIKEESTYQDDDYIVPMNFCQTNTQSEEVSIQVSINTLVDEVSQNPGNQDIPCQISISASELSEEAIENGRLGIDLVCILDVSGSMLQGKLEQCKSTLQFIIDTLTPKDRFSLCTFSSDAERKIKLTICNDQNKQNMISVIQSLSPISSTNIEFGIDCGLSVLRDRRVRNDLTSVLLLTDGQDDDSDSIQQRTVACIDQFAQQIGDYSIHCFGYGNDHDANLLNRIADYKNGTFYYIEHDNDIGEAFAICLGELVSIVADDIQVSLETLPTQPQAQISKVYSDTGNVFKMPVLYSESSKDSVFIVRIPPFQIEQQVIIQPVRIVVSYKLVRQGRIINEEHSLCLKLTPTPEGPVRVKENVLVSYFRVKAASAMKQSAELADNNRFQQAYNLISQLIEEIKRSPISQDQMVMMFQEDLTESSISIQNKAYWNRGGKATMMMHARSHMSQKASHGRAIYQNSVQQNYIARSKYFTG